MSGGTVLRRGQTDAERNVNRLRNVMPEKLATFCKMHLSFLLELDGAKLEEMFSDVKRPTATGISASKKKNVSTPFSAKKKERVCSGSMTLSKDLVASIQKLINFLHKPEHLCTEGLFRKTGNVSRQRMLKDWAVQGCGDDLDLGSGTFSAHDAATVLKQLLADLPDPLLTQKHYEAHLQIVEMHSHCTTERDRVRAKDKQLKALQLLMLLLPRENAVLLESLFSLLHKVAAVPENKMSASSLGVVFSPSLLCPRKLGPEAMQSVSPVLSRVIAVMIENATHLFTVPQELANDVAHFWSEMESPRKNMYSGDSEACSEDQANIQKTKYGSSSAVNTVLTFTDRKSPEEFDASQSTTVALAQLYAHVQSMPESAKKKKLLKQFNHAGGMQTNSAKKGKHSRSKSFGESLKKHFPSLTSKSKSRDICDADNSDGVTWSLTKPIIIDDSIANISYAKTPDNKLTPIMRNSPAVHIVDIGNSPYTVKPRKRLSDENIDSHVKDAKIPSKESCCDNNLTPCKRLNFTNTPKTPVRPVAMVSPITKTVTSIPEVTKKALITPKSRVPMMLIQSPNVSVIESAL